MSIQPRSVRRDFDSRIDPSPSASGPSLGESIAQITGDMKLLVQQEISLGKAEARQWVEETKQATAQTVAGTWMLGLGSILAAFGIIQGLEAVGVHSALATILTTILYVGAGYFLLTRPIKKGVSGGTDN